MADTKETTVERLPGHFKPGKRLLYLLCLVIAAYFVYLYLTRPRNLFEIATPIARAAEWKNSDLRASGQNYIPISNSETLMSVTKFEATHFLRQNHTHEGKIEVAIRMPLIIHSLQGNQGINYPLCVSPDGKFLAYASLSYIHYQRMILMNIYCIEKNVNYVWEIGIFTNPNQIEFLNLLWTRDSNSVIVLRNIKETDAIPIIDVYPITGRPQRSVTRPDLKRYFAACPYPKALGFSENGLLIVTTNGNPINSGEYQRFRDRGFLKVNIPKLEFMEFDIEQIGNSVHRFSIPVPKELDYGGAILSPKGKQILWAGVCSKETSLRKLLSKYIPSIPSDHKNVEKGWVSNLDGSGMHEIGYYEIPAYAPNRPPLPWIIDPKWSPDGKHIEFLFKDTVYAVPAD